MPSPASWSSSPTVAAIYAAASSAAKSSKGGGGDGKKAKKHYYYTARWFWAASCAVIAALLLLNIYKRLRAWRIRSKHSADPLVDTSNGTLPSKQDPVSITNAPAAVHASWSNIAFYKTSFYPTWLYSMPNVNELLFLAVYAALSILFAVHGTWSEKTKSFDTANQMGHIAYAQIPLIVGLAGKNNVISWMTGISYQKLNVLHRASGRLCLIFSWVHTIGRIQKGMSSGKHSIYQADMQWGVVAIIFYTFLTVASFRWLRNIGYEAFLIGHLIMVAGYLITAWLHWPPFAYWIYPGIILWGLDRVVRVGNVILLNKLWLIPMGKEKRAKMSECEVELLSSDVLRVTLSRDMLRWKAGQHAYLVMPTISAFPLEAHPFSMANVPSPEGPNRAVFIIKVHDGFTRRLRDAVSSQVTTNIPVYVDGPYGHGASLDHFASVLLVAGGTGITYAFGHFMQVVNQARLGKSAVRKLHLVWHIRETEHLQWILPLLEESLSTPVPNLAVEISIFTTLSASSSVTSLNEKEAEPASTAPSSLSSGDAEKLGTDDAKPEAAGLPIKWYSGRADLEAVLRSTVKEASVIASAAAVAVNVCGPWTLAASMRHAVAAVNAPSMVLRGQNEVVLYEETFGW